jgi:CBS domain-containing protein
LGGLFPVSQQILIVQRRKIPMQLGEQFRSEVVTVGPDETIQSAVWKMKDENVGAVVVLKNRKVVGILTDRDVAMRLGLGESELTTPVKEIMTKDVLTIWEDQGIFNATQYLMGHRIRRLPIINRQDELVGMVTLDDLFALLAQELRNLSAAVAPALQEKVPA